MTVGHALSEFAKRKILSAPIVVAPCLDDALDAGDSPPPDTPSFLGWIDTRDILAAFLRHLDDTLAEEGKVLPTRMLELMTLLEKAGPAFAATPLVRVRGGTDRELVYQAFASTSVLEAMANSFLHGHEDGGGEGDGPDGRQPTSSSRVVHRVAVFDGHGAITHVVSQLDVLKFLVAHKERLGGLAKRSLSDAGLLTGKPPVATVDPHTPTLLALKSMLAAGVSGAAVVATGSGVAIANLSISDLRAVQPHHLGVLALPVAEFLSVLHHTSFAGYSVGGSSPRSPSAAAHPFFATTSRGRAAPPSPSPLASSVSGGGGDAGVEDADSGGDVRVLTVTPQTSVADAAATMARTRVHRLYVADDPDAPLPSAVVTPTDVMRLVAGVF